MTWAMTKKRTIGEMVEFTVKLIWLMVSVMLMVWSCQPRVPQDVDVTSLQMEAQRQAEETLK